MKTHEGKLITFLKFSIRPRLTSNELDFDDFDFEKNFFSSRISDVVDIKHVRV